MIPAKAKKNSDRWARANPGPTGAVQTVLTLGGSDPSGGAGVQADLKVLHQHGVHGAAVPTMITVQNSTGVSQVALLDVLLVLAQVEAVMRDTGPSAVKVGALGSRSLTLAVGAWARGVDVPVVVDPVLVSTSGAPLLERSAWDALVQELLPYAALVTPNAPEASALTGLSVRDRPSAEEAARELIRRGARAVLVKGGHVGDADATDVLVTEDTLVALHAPRIPGGSPRGTGCAYASAIAAHLAQGAPLRTAVERAKRWITRAIEGAWSDGRGRKSLNFFAAP